MTSTDQAAAVDEVDPRVLYSHNTPASRDEQGRWLDPDSLEPVTYDVPDGAPAGMDSWRVTDLRRFRDEQATVPVLPYEDPQRALQRELAAADVASRQEEAARVRQDWLDQQLGQPPTNVDLANRPHFIHHVEGLEVCGQDGQPWPCDLWLGEVEPRDEAASAGTLRTGLAVAPDPSPEKIAEAARLLGMSVEDTETMLMRHDSADR